MPMLSTRPCLLALALGAATLSPHVTLVVFARASAQLSTRPEIEISHAPQRHYALTHAQIFVAPGDVREDATLVIQDGQVRDILRAGAALPAGAAVIDVAGKSIRPAFIDLASTVATDPNQACATSNAMGFLAPGGAEQGGGPGGEAAATAQVSGHWNKLVCPERAAAASLVFDEAKLKALRKLGFGYVLNHGNDGVLRGSSALISLRAGASVAQNLVRGNVTQDAALEQIFDFSGSYPTSYMGAVALLRQSFIDARWQAARRAAIEKGERLERPEANQALDALSDAARGAQPVMFFARDELDLNRAQRLAAENKLALITVGSGFEYRVLDQLDLKTPLVLPLNFPEAPVVEDPEKALEIALADLEHWRYSAFNPRLAQAHGLRFSLSARGLDKPEERFAANLAQAIRYGLSENQALAALTEVPASMIQARQIGTLKPGNLASFSISDANFMTAPDAKLYEMWVDGAREVFQALDGVALTGEWRFTQGVTGAPVLKITDASSALWFATAPPKTTPTNATAKASEAPEGTKISLSQIGARVLVQLPSAVAPALMQERAKGAVGTSSDAISLDLMLDGQVLSGRWFDARGVAHLVRAERSAPLAAEESKALAPVPSLPTVFSYPAGEYGLSATPKQATLLIQGATLWLTGKNAPETGLDVLLQNGRIAAIGPALKAPAGAQTLDASGMHLSPGLIDAHSHIAAAGNVNEGSHAVTSEVRIGDIIDPTDINIYRELAGGTTTSQVLHGSANPIGGQAQVIKHRWGAGAEALKFAGVVPTIKFALGENPKQANWGDSFTSRYPQTRMGVEAVLRAQFTQARSYGAALARDADTRRDLRLEPLLEILQGKRMVHIHSYRADEILMFVRLSQEFGFKVGAFQHVLEGYKVAKEISDIGAGASTFADWWGFKLEVVDAIPNNAAIMARQGVLVSLNSDSPDLGRHLNTEAAKTMRFGNLSATEALALVTINPAKQLRIDAEVGSIEVGKSADLVLWNHPPLSSMARTEKVWIDGRQYFDRQLDLSEQTRVDGARATLIQAALLERVKSLAAPAKPDSAKPEPKLALRSWQTKQHWPSVWWAKRGLYGNGEATHFCTDGE
jgi:imidazolonepropionase-like amidohydrolase